MGLFSSKKKTTVGTTVSRVIEDKALPDAVKSGTLKAILQNGDIPPYIMSEMVGSIAVRAERMYSYAERSYEHGLPSGEYQSSARGKEEVEALLTSIEGEPVAIDYIRFAPANDLHIGWMKLIADHGYDPATNKMGNLSTAQGKNIYLDDMVVVIPSADIALMNSGAIDQWGYSPKGGYTPERIGSLFGTSRLLAHSPIEVDAQATDRYLKVTYVWQESEEIERAIFNIVILGEIERATFNIAIEGYDDDAEYFHVKYSVGDVVKYWMYEAGTGVFPTLDDVFNKPPEINGEFFPFAYFRFNKTSETSDKTTAAYRTSKKLVKYLGMDYDIVANAIDANPEVEDVEQAMMIMAVPAESENPIERRYLYEFFDDLYYSADYKAISDSYLAIRLALAGDENLIRHTMIIQDKRFKMALSNGGMFKKRKVGKIGAKGTYTSGTFTSYETVPVDYGELGMGSQTFSALNHYYRKQISENIYDEITIRNLLMQYFVYGKYTTTSDEDARTLLIPLDRNITKHYTFPDREELYSRSLHYVFNSRVVTKVKWYQQDWFQFVMIVVAVVLTVFSFGASGGAWGQLAAGIAAGSTAVITTALLAIIESLLFGLLISEAFQLIAKAVGLELAFIIAIVGAMYGGYSKFTTGSVTGAPFAKELLFVANSLTKAISSTLQEAMGDLLKEADSFTKYVEDQTKLLDTAQELLEGNNLLSPFVLFGESPNDFYNRTVHSGNIGVIGISAITNYVDAALTLPKLNASIGEMVYES